MDSTQFRELLVRPALVSVNLYSEAAENLLVGTGLAESHLEYVKQINGPALSFLQIEPSTYNDCYRYLRVRNPDLKEKIHCSLLVECFPPYECSTWNIRLAILIARVKYFMRPEPLPDARDADAMCYYYLKWYATALSKATHSKSISHFLRACALK